MLKVFGFVTRHPRLSHDEYRAAHVGYHNSFGRRLNNIRGYLLNVASNTPIEATLGSDLVSLLTKNEQANFDAQWDGWGQLLFDNYTDYISAKTPARDRAGPNGLGDDSMVAKVGGDFDTLYAGSPFQFHVDEHVAQPVIRPERKLFKLAQFVKRPADLAPELFRAYLTGQYASLATEIPGLRGMVINLRTNLDVMTKFFADGSEAFTPAGTVRRNEFYSGWDAIAEYWFDTPKNFVTARVKGNLNTQLSELENKLFDAVFYREVDETVAVLPKRNPAPPFYHR